MKAITLWQPWASLVAIGAKKYETRSWATSYRGQIAIHAARNYPPYAQTLAELDTQFLRSLGHEFGDDKFKKLPFGFVIAIAELVGCWEIDRIQEFSSAPWETGYWYGKMKWHDVSEQEILFGDWAPGRYAWQLENVHQLVTPIQVKGHQRLWDWQPPEEVQYAQSSNQ